MATPAAVLSILVKAQGVQAASSQLATLDKTGRKAGTGLANTEKQTKSTSKAFSAMGTAAKGAGVLIGGVGLVKGLKAANDEYREAQKVGAQTTAVLKSTGNAAKVTQKHIEDLAGSISKKSGIDDEAIQSSANLLLTFTKLRNETGKGNQIFDRATQVVTDMSVALGQSGKSSAIQLGKALNDPIKGITALRRVGVSFTADQEKQIKTMVESGNLLGAQKRILRELTTEFGGSAAAQATAGDKLKVSLGNLAEAAGGILVPALDKVAVFFTRLINQFVEGKGIARVLIANFLAVGQALKPFGVSVVQITKFLADQNKTVLILIPTLALLAKTIIALNIAVRANPWVAAATALALLVVGFVTAYRESERFRNIVDSVVKTVGPTFVAAFAVATQAVRALPGAFTTAVATIVSTFNTVKSTVLGVTSAITTETGKWKVAFAVFGVIATVAKVNIGILVTGVKAGLSLLAPVFTATFGVIRAIVTGAFTALRAIVSGGLQVLRGIVQVFGGVLKGDFQQIWEGIKNIFRGIGSAIAGILRAQLGTIWDAGKALGIGLVSGFKSALNLAHELAVAMRDLIAKAPGYAFGVGKAIISGIIDGIKSAAGGIGDALGRAVKGAVPKLPDLNPFGEGIGAGAIVPLKGGGNLMGARAAMGPFAAIGAANGLRVSSGLRSGATTSSGNPSWHSTGEAVDLAGSPAGMMKTFKTLRSRYGSRLAELIYTPGGAGIKDGKTHVYSGKVAADHFDHVHVAFDSGKAGQGDGVGKARRAGVAMGDGTGGNVKAVWKFLISKGFTPEQAAGIIGGLMGESGKGLSTTARNKSSGAFGIAQWLGGRKSALMKRKNPTSLSTQLDHLWSELQGPEAGAFKAVKGAKSVEAAVKAWVLKFERPGAHETTLGPRTSSAQSVFKALKGVGGKGAGKAPVDKVSNFEMIQAMAETAIAQAEGTPKVADDILANTQLRDATTFRIKEVRKALKKPNLKPSTRLRLTQELGGLVGKHTGLQGTLKDLRTKPGFDALDKATGINDARLSIAQGTESLADDLGPLQERVNILGKVFELTQKKFGAGSAEAAQAFADLTSASQTLAKTQRDAIFQPFQQMLQAGSAQLTMAQVFSPGDTKDDLTALNNSLGVATAAFLEAVNRGDTDAINEFGGQVLSLRGSIEQLQASVEQNTQAMLDLQKQQTEDARRLYNVSQSQYGVLAKAIADVASGQIGGNVGLGFMSPSFPGGGSRY